jgi:hypothetical protein
MKKLAFILWMFGSAAAAFSLGFSYGGGTSLAFSPVTFNGTYSGTASQVTSFVSLTALQFFDATYVQVQIGYSLNRGSTEPAAASTTTGFAALLTGLSFGVAVKYPFVIGPVAIFPFVGAEYKLNLTYTDDKGDDLKSGLSGSPSALNELWLKGGVGVDVYFGSLFLRPVVLVGFMPFTLGGAPTLSSTDPNGIWSISLDRGVFSVELDLLFGCRL